jgi:peptidoglycan hydrolase-like protein with peptidoglycan-binding domain
MKQSKLVFPAVMLSGILGVTLTPGWSQTKGGSSGSSGSQTDQGSPSSGSSGMKSSDTGKTRSSDTDKGTSSGAESSAKGSQGQWAKEDIKKVQEALKEKGQDPGPADGVMGAQTQKALRAFQSKNGLKATGRLDAETAKALGVEGGSASSMGSSGGSSSTGSSAGSSSRGSSSMEKGSSSKGSGSSATGSDSSSKDK